MLKNIYKKIFRWLAWVLLTLLVIIIFGVIFFYIKKDDLTKELLLKANTSIQGELIVKDLAIDPIDHFPKIALQLEEVLLYERKGETADPTITPILDLSSIDVSFDILKLINSEIEITELSMENGKVYLNQDPSGAYNLEHALKPIDSNQHTTRKTAIQKQPTNTSSSSSKKSDKIEKKNDSLTASLEKTRSTDPSENNGETTKESFNLAIEDLEIQDIQFLIDMSPTEQQQRFSLDYADAGFKYVKDSIEVEMIAKWGIDQLGINRNTKIEDEELLTTVDFNYDKGEQIINIYQSDIEFKNAHLYLNGSVDLKGEGMADLEFEAGDDELAFTKLFLSSEGIDNLKSGNLYLKGTIQGPFEDQIPNISVDFGADGLNIELPKTREYVRDLKIDGHFNSGTRNDLSNASINIDTLHAILPTGYVRMTAIVNNFKDPGILYDLDASFRLDNLGRFFDLGPVDSLVGHVQINDSYRGSLRGPLPDKDKSAEHFTIKLDEVSFNIPEVIDIDELSGVISGNIDTLRIDTLNLRSVDSDFEVRGVLKELSNMIFDQDTLVLADLKIRSQKFNFPVLFKALPQTAEAFPYVIRDISIEASVQTSKEKLDNFWKVPEMDFEIREVAASVDSLLNYVRLRDGEFKMYEKDSTFFLDFNDFKLLTDDNVSEAAFQFIEREGKRDSMNLTLNTDGLNLTQVLEIGEDSIPGLTNAWFGGDYRGTIVLPFEQEDTKFIHSADLIVEDIIYRAKDTITASRFEYKTENISYEGETTKAVLATLDAENEFYFKDLESPFFQSDSLGLQVNIKDGIIAISPQFYDEFAKGESGIIKLFPYEEPPKFELDYTINDLPLEDFLKTFNSEELLKGSVDIKLDLDANGLDLESITSSLSGSIYVVGDSLMLQGLNLDEVIRDFQRSQSFNLVDVGAVVLAGPAGIVYSKGSSYVSLLTANKNDSTRISKFSSKWNLDSGRIKVDDVAFATLKNRVAATGWLDMKTDSLDITIGVLNEKGCAIFDQRLYGRSDDPQYSKVKFLKTLLAPVTNVIKGAVGVKCDVFYDGIVTHPEEPKKKKDKS